MMWVKGRVGLGDEIIPDINYHLTNSCNMKCRFCFATFRNSKQLSRRDCLRIVDMVGKAGFQKINFVGGEPTLCPWLNELLARAKEHNLKTSIVTNGTRITKCLEENLRNLDCIGLSIDSLKSKTNEAIGRIVRGQEAPDEDFYKSRCQLITEAGIELKINTVVTSQNLHEIFTTFIEEVRPIKWKIFQVLGIQGDNERSVSDLKITQAQFKSFLLRNTDAINYTNVFPEDNTAMTGSYIMIEPSGRFFDNTSGRYIHSPPILDVGWEYALKTITYDYQKYLIRKNIDLSSLHTSSSEDKTLRR